MTRNKELDGGATTRTAYRDLTNTEEEPGALMPRAYRTMEPENLVAHFVKHVPERRERWDQILAEPLTDQLYGRLEELRLELAAALSAPASKSWRWLVHSAAETGEAGRAAFAVVMNTLVTEYSEVLADYERVAIQTAERSARAPSHCSYDDREGYVVADAVLVVLTPDRESPESYHRAITCFRQQAGAGALPAERLERLRQYLMRKGLDGAFTRSFWRGSEP